MNEISMNKQHLSLFIRPLFRCSLHVEWLYFTFRGTSASIACECVCLMFVLHFIQHCRQRRRFPAIQCRIIYSVELRKTRNKWIFIDIVRCKTMEILKFMKLFLSFPLCTLLFAECRCTEVYHERRNSTSSGTIHVSARSV